MVRYIEILRIEEKIEGEKKMERNRDERFTLFILRSAATPLVSCETDDSFAFIMFSRFS